MRDVLLYSGGLDSYIAWHYLGKPKAVYFALGHKYQNHEMRAIKNIKLIHRDLRMGFMHLYIAEDLYLAEREEPGAHIPMRNLLLASCAAHYGDRIWLVVQEGETDLEDRNRPFFHRTGNLLTKLMKKQITLDSPFWDMTKVDMVKWYLDQGLNTKPLLSTRSCYRNTETPCGNCPACFRRWVALELNGLSETYLENPWESDVAQEYVKRVVYGQILGKRAEETEKALQSKGVML